MNLRLAVGSTLFGLAWSVLPPSHAAADVTPHGLFQSNMVLQQQMAVPVWGTAADGEKVSVTLADQTVETIAKDGRWQVTLKPLQAGGPFQLVIQGNNRVVLDNVLVGEVWVCSGQSNMQFSMEGVPNAKEAIAQSENPRLRLITLRRQGRSTPQDDVQADWVECGPKTLGSFSAVGYFFGKALQAKLDVPIGLINGNVGGTRAEQWTSRETLQSLPELRHLAENDSSSKLYNGIIHPLMPFAIRGVIWYQGESNAGRAYQYRTLFPAMIANWRQAWGQGDFPFLFVQLAPFQAIVGEPQESELAELREAQLLTMLKAPHTAMAVITDVGDEKDIHPNQKQPVGERLALAARALAYGENVVYSGPVYKGMTTSGNQAIVSFTHANDGLTAKGDKLSGFTMAGPDKKFHNAQAEIKDDTVVVVSDQVPRPIAVRYGWADYPLGNLANKNGLLASPFRTDDFPGLTAERR